MTKESLKIDLHMHTTVSDGTDSPEEIAEKVRGLGINVFSVTDHDAIKGCGIIRSLDLGDIRFISGAEFNCRDEFGRYHVLGYGFSPDDPLMDALVEKGHTLRMDKVRMRIELLEKEFGFSFSQEDVQELLSRDNPGKPHIGNLMVSYGFAPSRDVAIEEYIDKLKFKKEYIHPAEVIETVKKCGGIPVLAHPPYGTGNDIIVGDELDARVARMKELGLMGVEAFYSGYSPKLCKEVLALADKYDLYVTAGSDYHGHNKMIDLGDTGMRHDRPLPVALVSFLDRCL